MRSAIGKIHPNTSNELPSNAIITQNSEKSTLKGQFSLKENSSESKNPNSYTKAEATEMVSGILTEF